MQVALLSGVDAEGIQGVLKSKAHDGVHLNNALKLVTIRKEKGKERQGIALPGGPYIPSIDGPGDPSKCVPCLLACTSQGVLEWSRAAMWSHVERQGQRQAATPGCGCSVGHASPGFRLPSGDAAGQVARAVHYC